jgi:hypothetical protein
MNIDLTSIVVLVLLLCAVLAYSLTHFRRQFLSLYAYTAVLLVLFLLLLSIALRSRGMLQVIYPWGLPLIFALPTMVQLNHSALTRTKNENWVYYSLFLMPIFAIISGYGILTKASLYHKNLDRLFAGEFLELEHLLGNVISSIPYFLIFSAVHSTLLILKLRDARISGPSWVLLVLPVVNIILGVGCFFAVVATVMGISSGQFLFLVLSLASLAVGTYLVALTLYEEQKLTSIISNAMFFAPSKNKVIEDFLLNQGVNVLSILFQDFTKQNLADLSHISYSDWDTFFTEQRFSWPEFKNRVRIRYALQRLNSGYLATKTVESLSLELGFKSRKSFYTAFEAVTGKSFRGEVYR